jgi:hypothetical protein
VLPFGRKVKGKEKASRVLRGTKHPEMRKLRTGWK